MDTVNFTSYFRSELAPLPAAQLNAFKMISKNYLKYHKHKETRAKQTDSTSLEKYNTIQPQFVKIY